MTTLAYRTNQYTLSQASEGIVEVLAAVANQMPNRGFTGVKHDGHHVYANMAGCGVTLFYLPIANRTFWQIVAGHGPDHGTIDPALEEVKQIVQNLHFL